MGIFLTYFMNALPLVLAVSLIVSFRADGQVSDAYALAIGLLWVVPPFALMDYLALTGKMEKLFIMIQPWRSASNRELLILSPLIDEVSQKLGHSIPNIYINESKEINACAFGTNTLCINSGSMSELSKDELQAVIGHEFGHLINKDSIGLLRKCCARLITDKVYDAIIRITKLHFKILGAFGSLGGIAGFGAMMFMVVAAGPLYFFYILMLPTKIIDRRILPYFEAKVAQNAELLADKAGATATSPKIMASALERLQEKTETQPSSFVERLLHDHPPIAYRLDALDVLGGRGGNTAMKAG